MGAETVAATGVEQVAAAVGGVARPLAPSVETKGEAGLAEALVALAVTEV